MKSTVICAFYHFVQLDDYEALRQPLLDLLLSNKIKGTMLLAREGINGTVAGTRQAIDALTGWLQADPRFKNLRWKEAVETEPPFYRTKVKLKKEIVTMGVEDIDPRHIVGTYIKPLDWNELISRPDVLLVDTRNEYEVQTGTFKNAINPQTRSFREFPKFVEKNLDPQTHKKVAMFCTGGIRCEKSTAYLKSQGFDEVYHLEGGILKYLEQVPADESLWQGECFVFDNRVTVNHQLEAGSFDQCHACRMPITEQDKKSQAFAEGISCPNCIGEHSQQQLARFGEREKQVQLAKARGEDHIGSDALLAQQKHREEKQTKKAKQRKG